MGIQINGQTDTISAIDGSITVGTDLTVPGVVTYEDVSNVDSVGVITARSGINVTGGDVTLANNLLIPEDKKIHLEGGSGDDYNAIWKADAENTVFVTSRFHMANIIDSNNDDSTAYWSVRKDGTTLAGSDELMRVQSNGNVGIGTDNPASNLHVIGTIRVGESGEYTVDDSRVQHNLRITCPQFTGRGSDGYVDLKGDSGATSFVRILDSGNVGIGTQSPDYRLTVANTSSYVIQNLKSSTTEFCGIYFGDTDGAGRGTIVYDNNVDAMTFRTNGSGEDLRIDSSGRLLVGTVIDTSGSDTNALVQLAHSSGCQLLLGRDDTSVVSGNDIGVIKFRARSGASSTYLSSAEIHCRADQDHTTGGTDSPGLLEFRTTSDGVSTPTQSMVLSQDKRFYLSSTWYSNITTANAANVHAISNGEFYRSTSSIKYKTDVETLQDSYADAILNVRPVWYRSTCQDDNPAHSWWGFIAEDVAEIDPRLVQWKTKEVTYDDNGSAVETPCDPEPEGIAYDRFVPHLLNLIKRQKEQIETLETTNASQAVTIAALDARLTALEGA